MLGESEESTEALQAKLEKLKAEVRPVPSPDRLSVLMAHIYVCMHILIHILTSRPMTQAASLGIPVAAEAPATPYGSTSYRPYRGRGRGARSFYRGAMRGGPPRASMKLDNRPKKLLVKGASPESTQAVRDWYEVRVARHTWPFPPCLLAVSC